MLDYTLRVYDPVVPKLAASVTDTADKAVRDITQQLVKGFPRAISMQWGMLDGLAVLQGPIGEMLDIFDTWLGKHVEERQGSAVTWEGFIYRIDLIWKGDRDRRAILGVPVKEQLWNAVRTIYTNPSVSQSDELCSNSSFEIAGAGGADVFQDWAEAAGSGTIARSAAQQVLGSYSAALTDGGLSNVYISQYFTVNPADEMYLGVQCYGTGTLAGQYLIYDETNGANIVAATTTGQTAASWALLEVDFTVPANCKTVRIDLIAAPVASGGVTVYFDDCSVKKYKDTRLETDWATEAQSIARYGRKEYKFDVGYTNQTNAEKARDRLLAEHCWPFARPVSTTEKDAGKFDEAKVELYIGGYGLTANYRYLTENTSGSINYDVLITNIINNDCEFLNAKSIAPHSSTMLSQDLLSQVNGIITERAGTAIMRLVNMSDTGSTPHQFYVDTGRNCIYREIDFSPKYYRRGGKYASNISGNKSVHPRHMRPGVVRRMDRPDGGGQKGSVLEDRRDMLATTMQVDEKGQAHAIIDSSPETDVYRYQDTRSRSYKVTGPIGTDGGQVFPQIQTVDGDSYADYGTIDYIPPWLQELIE